MEPNPLPRLTSLHVHRTRLETEHKIFSLKGTLLTDYHFLWGYLHFSYPTWQGCHGHTQTSSQGDNVLHCAALTHPTTPLRRDAPKTYGHRVSVLKRWGNLLISLCFASEIQPRKAEKNGLLRQKHAHVFTDLERLRPRKRQCVNRTEPKVGQKCCCKAWRLWRTSLSGF